MDGFINLYKPKAFTSHDALNIIRRNFRGTKVGHGGTLDPDATGVLPVCIGKGTKLQDLVMGGDKAYRADVIFGLTSLSLDCGEEVTVTDDHYALDTVKLKTVLRSFLGKQEQYPPMVSAIKQNGVPLYKLARRGKTVETEPRSIEIYELELLEVHAEEPQPRIRIEIKCSKGTYIRSLGRDLGEAMGTTAVIDNLERTASGMFTLENAYSMEQIKALCEAKDYSFLLPMEAAVSSLPSFSLKNGEQWRAILGGASVPIADFPEGEVAIFDPCGELMAIGKAEDGNIKPQKILWESRKRKAPMVIKKDLTPLSPENDTAVVIGNFDGVHLGHRFLIEHCVKEAEKAGLLSAALTFDPHPDVFFGKTEHCYLQSEAQKCTLIDALGVDMLICAPFNESLANMTEESFISEILIKSLRAKTVFVGDDFSFGCGGRGDAKALKEKCSKYQMEVRILPQLTYGQEEISSSRIKSLLQKGNVREASQLLGRPYTVEGEVLHGREIGRTIGFPTANLAFAPHLLVPRSGVYGALVRIDGKKYQSIASIGRRPTIAEGQTVNLEAHILDFDGDLYGKNISVTLLTFLRNEKKFDSLDALKAGITADIENVKNYFQKRNFSSCNRS